MAHQRIIGGSRDEFDAVTRTVNGRRMDQAQRRWDYYDLLGSVMRGSGRN